MKHLQFVCFFSLVLILAIIFVISIFLFLVSRVL